jgi:hypothetical protein
MKWSDLLKANRYGECPSDDAVRMAAEIGRYVKQRGVSTTMNSTKLAIQILRYIQMRHTVAAHNISAVPGELYYPDGWSAAEEEIWNDWINHHCTPESWYDEVITPVFGEDVRLWEAPIDGWREELLQFLSLWIRRSREIVVAYDPTPIVPNEDESTDKIDPYLLEHGSSRQKRDALKHSSDVY